jgi:multicomponent Na+:H+ antiporter subunit E
VTTFVGGLFTLRRVLTVAGLVLAWCALWGAFSAANVLSGLAASLVAMGVGLGGSGRGGVRVVPLAQFCWLVAVDLAVSTATVVHEVLTPTDYTEEGIIAVSVPPACRHHLLMLYVAITVTPGTAVVAAESDGSVLYLHVLHCDRRDAVEAHVHRLARLAIDALPEPGPAPEVAS